MTLSLQIADLRMNYSKESLSEESVDKDPVIQFETWFLEAMKSEIPEPNAMALGTVGANGRPSIRIVLLKGVDQSGFVFFTNYQSRKGQDLAAKPYGCLNFLWLGLERQVRIEGRVEKISAQESDAYFESRPEGSRLGAWVSPQSRKISKDELENRLSEMTERFEGKDMTRPAHWGGYRLIPDCMEFWQGRPNRLHDRILYEKVNGLWQISRLAP